MDRKIILAVAIVALIGVVAATYHVTTNGGIESLASVETEDIPASDAVDVDDSGSGVNDASSGDGSSGSGSDSKDTSNDHSSGSKASADSKNSGASSSGSSSSVKKNNGGSASSSGISQASAIAIANTWAKKNNVKGSAHIYGTFIANGVKYYQISFTNNGKVIGEVEVNSKTGSVSGGKFNDVKPPATNTHKTNNSKVNASNSSD